MLRVSTVVLALTFIAMGCGAVQAEEPVVTVTIKDHRFIPEDVEIPAGQKVKLIVKNEDATPEEFESFELNREKIVAGKSQAVIFIGPVSAGAYPFFGEFNKDTAKGRLIAK